MDSNRLPSLLDSLAGMPKKRGRDPKQDLDLSFRTVFWLACLRALGLGHLKNIFLTSYHTLIYLDGGTFSLFGKIVHDI